MDEETRAVLEDLTKIFGLKKVLSPKDIAPLLDSSEPALAMLRKRKRFPLEPVTEGRTLGYSIYHLAEFLAHGKAPKQTTPDVTSDGEGNQKAATAKKKGRPRINRKYEQIFAWKNEVTYRFESAKLELELIEELERLSSLSDQNI